MISRNNMLQINIPKSLHRFWFAKCRKLQQINLRNLDCSTKQRKKASNVLRSHSYKNLLKIKQLSYASIARAPSIFIKKVQLWVKKNCMPGWHSNVSTCKTANSKRRNLMRDTAYLMCVKARLDSSDRDSINKSVC